MNIRPHQISPDRLLLDPNNYRFHDVLGYKSVGTYGRYGEDSVQDRALQTLRATESFELASLKDSIQTNGYVPIEQIVVEQYDGEGDDARYLVIEGNRRVAAVKTLLEDHAGGYVDLEDDTHDTLRKLPVLEIVGNSEELRDYRQTLMAIRHVAGIKEWGPYQQAKLVVELYEQGEETFGPVAQRIGISSREVARRYRASKALQQMEEDDEFGEYANPKLYVFFHEAVSQPKVREWIDFSDATYKAEDDDARRVFYELLSPRDLDGEVKQPKLQNANRQVRQLKDIVDKPLPLKILADPEKEFDDAVRAAEDESIKDETGVLEHSLGVAIHALKQPSIDAWANPSDNAVELWHELDRLVKSVSLVMTDRSK